MHRHTAAVSMRGSTAGRPSRSAVRIRCAALAAASSALLGTQPVHRQSPPGRPASTAATLRPSLAASSAAISPAEPMPTTTRS